MMFGWWHDMGRDERKMAALMVFLTALGVFLYIFLPEPVEPASYPSCGDCHSGRIDEAEACDEMLRAIASGGRVIIEPPGTLVMAGMGGNDGVENE